MIDTGPFRLDPALPAGAYETYQILAPTQTHWRKATCAEVDCPQQAHGWITRVDERTPLGQAQATYIRRESGRSFRESRSPEALTEFTFEAGQTCFAQHQTRLDRPELFLRRHGDWRGNPTGERPYVHTQAEHWVEDFALNQDRIHTIIERG